MLFSYDVVGALQLSLERTSRLSCRGGLFLIYHEGEQEEEDEMASWDPVTTDQSFSN